LIANFLARCVFDRSLFCYTGWVEMFRPARGHRGGRVITAGRNETVTKLVELTFRLRLLTRGLLVVTVVEKVQS
jgi:hypothetical protein